MSYGLYLKPYPDNEESQTHSLLELEDERRIFWRSIALKVGLYDLGFVLREYKHSLELHNIKSGLQISFYDYSVSFTLPYWYTGQQAHFVFKKIWKYIEIIQHDSGYIAYDDQLGRALNLTTDFDNVVQAYLGTMGKIDTILPPADQSYTPT